MDDREFIEKAKELKTQFEEKVKLLRDEYHREIQDITKSIEGKRLSGLKKDLGI